jgi:hypothetical protein
MKTFILATILISAFSSGAFAEEICGTLGSYDVGPNCQAGEACPMFVRLQFDLLTAQGYRYDLGASSMSMLNSFSQFKGTNVCVTGTEEQSTLEVTQITAQ